LGTRLDAVVVDHDAGEVLGRCVESLRVAGAGRVVVVDNAVPAGRSKKVLAAAAAAAAAGKAAAATAGKAAAATPASHQDVIETGTNLGYGAGVNRGAAACTAELMLVCNADLVVDPTALEQLAACLDLDAGIAIAGPRVNEPDGTRYPSARRFPSLLEGAGHALAGLVAPGNRYTRSYRMEHLSSTDDTPVDWVSGSCMLVRRKAFEELGGFDEAYFMYAEDVDICWRAHQAGWGVAYVPTASVTHLRAVSTSRNPYRMLAAHHRSTLRFASRTLSGPRRLALPAIAVALGVRFAAATARQALLPRLNGGPDQGASERAPSDG
jgi:N-acetylglucosaminyl-diphospho-decaprenol L-rhamnosyltransferase